MMKYFFWIAFAVFLAASIPHVAYFFASFEPSDGPAGIWWWTVSYAIAISIDVTVYLLSWTAFQRYRKYGTPKAVWQHWLLILICTIFSWGVNWAYAKQFHNPSMLSEAEAVASWLTHIFPFMASSFPLLGIVYTMMAETITETAAEEKREKNEQFSTLNELSKQTQLPVGSIRRALAYGSRLNPSNLLTSASNRTIGSEAPPISETTSSEMEKADPNRPITGHFVTLEESPNTSTKGRSASSLFTVSGEGNPDKLQMTIEALRARPDMTDEALAEFLSLKRPASARFWRLKAIEILNTLEKEGSETSTSTSTRSAWGSTGTMANGMSTKR